MKPTSSFTFVKWGLGVSLILALTTLSVYSQSGKSDVLNITKITPEIINAPDGGGKADRDKWLRVEFDFAVEDQKESDYLDEVQFRIFIECEVPTGKKSSKKTSPAVLYGEVTYVNVEANAEHKGVFYVHPDTVTRFGRDSFFTRKGNIHIEVYVGGQMIGGMSRKQDRDGETWYTRLRRIEGMVYNINFTPWMIEDAGDYPAIKLTK